MKKLKGLVVPLVLVAFWWMGSEAGWFNNYIVPHPARVGKTALGLMKRGTLFRHMGVSLGRVFAGFAAAFGAAFPLALLAGLNKRLYAYLEPFMEFVRHIPPIAMIPLLILWFGIGEVSKLAVIVLATFFPIFINTAGGMVQCDPGLLEVGRTFGFSGVETFFRIRLPQAMPAILSGMRLGLGYSWRSLMGAELIAASSGIGYMIIEAEQLSRIDIIFVGVLAIGSAGCVLDHLFFRWTERLIRWKEEDHERHANQTAVQDLQA